MTASVFPYRPVYTYSRRLERIVLGPLLLLGPTPRPQMSSVLQRPDVTVEVNGVANRLRIGDPWGRPTLGRNPGVLKEQDTAISSSA